MEPLPAARTCVSPPLRSTELYGVSEPLQPCGPPVSVHDWPIAYGSRNAVLLVLSAADSIETDFVGPRMFARSAAGNTAAGAWPASAAKPAPLSSSTRQLPCV